MKVLLDEMLPIGLQELLPGHDVHSAAHAGLAGMSNGALIRGAVSGGFDVLVTLDRSIPHQQNLARYSLGFVLIEHNDVDLVRPYAARLRTAIDASAPGTVVRVGSNE
jgi:hypothetical protein